MLRFREDGSHKVLVCSIVANFFFFFFFYFHSRLPSYYAALKRYHLEHHFADYTHGFGVTSPFWDYVFGTELQLPEPKVVKTQ